MTVGGGCGYPVGDFASSAPRATAARASVGYVRAECGFASRALTPLHRVRAIGSNPEANLTWAQDYPLQAGESIPAPGRVKGAFRASLARSGAIGFADP